MGVPGLWKEIQGHGNECAIARLSEVVGRPSSSSSPAGSLRLGIDVSGWLYHANKSVGGHNPHLRSFFWRLCRLLAIPFLLPVFVFDGPLRPKEKRGKIQSYREAHFIGDLKNLINAFGFIVFEAVGEAEAEMARMNQKGLLDAVLSDDVDCFVFGARCVVRNWGQELSGSKARTEYVAERSASAEASPLSGEEQSNMPPEKSSVSAGDRLALGKNLLTYFNVSDLNESGLTQNGLILVAILSGGDYDVQGLPRCGVKISIALAKAGFGDSLIAGMYKHCMPPKRSQSVPSARLAAPQPKGTWSTFLMDWIALVRHELSTNESGYLGRKFKKLSESDGFNELLSTKASLSVLGSYVWPLTTDEVPDFTFGSTDVRKIAEMCQRMFHWPASLALQTFRNQLWTGCVTRELAGDSISGLARPSSSAPKSSDQAATIKPPPKSKKTGTKSGSISTFFEARRVDINPRLRSEESVTPPPIIISIAGERQLGSTGYVKEVRLVCDVRAYVELAEKGLDYSLIFTAREEIDTPTSSQTSLTPSPRKRRPFAHPNDELRLCMAESVMQRNPSSARLLADYRSKRKHSAAKTSRAEGGKKSDIVTGKIDSFFAAKKATNSIAISKRQSIQSPLKRSAPLQSSSQTSLSSAPSESPLSSPTLRASTPRRPRKEGERIREGSSGPLQQNVPRESSPRLRETVKANATIVRRALWSEDVLDNSDVENGGLDDSLDTSLPHLRFPSAPIDAENTRQSSMDTSIEFVRATKAATTMKNFSSGRAIEVSDDSDEDG
ncbi:hypothetical protein CBS101457_001793 [Exobasidium rhododendri]|nr:hypothetical protein CBS101457_001793 [Exobasidium rhododendri]